MAGGIMSKRKLVGICVLALVSLVLAYAVWFVHSIHARLEDQLADSDCNSLAGNLAGEEAGDTSERPPGDCGVGMNDGIPIDRWGTPYRTNVVIEGGLASITVTSAGRDRRFGTEDDISVEREFGSSESPSP
jgi:hypothetical protein